MEDITLERLLRDFKGVIDQINGIVERNDIESAREVLRQIGELVASNEHVELDTPESEGHDHILHRLLDSIQGVIEVSELSTNDPNVKALIDERERIDREIKDIDFEIEHLGEGGEVIVSIEEVEKTIQELRRLQARRRSVANNQRTSDATREAALAEIAELESRIAALTAIVERMRNGGQVQTPVDTTEIDRQIAEKEQEISDIEKEIAELTTRNNGTPSGLTDAEQARINELNELIISRTALVNQLNEDLQRLERDSEDWARAFTQRRELNNEIATLRAELEAISNRGQNPGTRTVEESRNILLDGIEMPETMRTLEEQRQYAISEFERLTGQTFNPDIHEIIFDGAEGDEYSDTPITVFRVEEVVKREVPTRGLTDEEIVRMAELEQLIASRTALVNQLNEDLQRLERDSEDWARAFAQRRELNNEIAGYVAELEALRQRDDGIRRGGNDSRREELRRQLEEKQRELEELRKTRAQMLQNAPTRTSKINNADLILVYEEQIRVLQARLASARRKGKNKPENAEEIKKLDQQIEEIKKRIEVLRKGETVVSKEDNAKRKEELLKRKEELLARRKEIDQKIAEAKKTTQKTTEKLDLGEEARRIGDKIFKTAAIRAELSERGVTREEFLEFYMRGRDASQAAIDTLSQRYDELKQVWAEIVVDQEEQGENLYAQLEKAKTPEEKIAVLENIRKNMLAAGRFDNDLKALGFYDKGITSAEDAAKFEKFFMDVSKHIDDEFREIRNEVNDHRENIQIFSREITKIQDEIASLRAAEGNVEELSQRDEAEKELRARQIRATIFGDPELEAEWDAAVKRFASHRVVAKEPYRYMGSDGEMHEIRYQTVEDYQEEGGSYSKDAYFLNLHDYRRCLENVSKFEASGGDPAVLDLSGHEFDQYRMMEAEKPGSGRELLLSIMSQQKDYVRTFHGFTNEHAVKYANYRTAGSTLKAMLPVRGDLPTHVKFANGLTNIARFFSLRAPKFTRVNSKGETVPAPVGGTLTVLSDALVVGGVAAAAAIGPAALVPIGIGYAAKGIVTLGNLIAGRREYRVHGEQIEQNLPTLAHPSARDREVARREYYRDIEHYSRPRAWFRAKMDKYFFRNSRALDTQEKIAQRAIEKSNYVIDERNKVATGNARANIEQARRNQEIRERNLRTEIRGEDFYNEVVADPDSVDKDLALETAARNAAIYSAGKAKDSGEMVNITNAQIKDKYQKQGDEFEATGDLAEVRTEGGTATVAGITEAQKYRARMEKQDSINRALTIILSTVGNVGYAALKNKFQTQENVRSKDPDQQEAVYRDEPVYDQVERTRDITERRQIPHEEQVQQTTEVADPNMTLSDLQYGTNAYNEAYNFTGKITQANSTMPSIDAMAIRVVGQDGRPYVISFSEAGSPIKVGQHVGFNLPQGMQLEGMTVTDVVEKILRPKKSFEGLCERLGLPTSAPSEDIATALLKNNAIFAQTKRGMPGWQVAENGLTQATNMTTNTVYTWEDVVVGQEKYLETVQTGTRQVVDHYITIPGQVHEQTRTVFNPDQVRQAVDHGIAGGAFAAVIDEFHEAAHPTDKTMQGTFEDKNPDLFISRLAKIAQDEYDRTHGKNTRGRLSDSSSGAPNRNDEDLDDERE